MFDTLTNLTKATVGVALTPVTITADIVALVTDTDDVDEEFHRTDDMLDKVADCIDKALHPTD